MFQARTHVTASAARGASEARRTRALGAAPTKEAPTVPIALLVDDDEDVRSLLTLTVGRVGMSAVEAYDGKHALEVLQGITPDLVLLDVQMPRMSGIEVCWWIRKEPRLAHVPVILVSARTSQPEIDAGLLAGANHYVTKPFSPTKLAALIASMFPQVAAGSVEQPPVPDDRIGPPIAGIHIP
jgi:DNA-binding response OmpR family regulator